MKQCIILFFLSILSSAFFSQGFTDVGEDFDLFSSSIDAYYGTGVSCYDINYDGWDDLTIGDVNGKVDVYINNEGVLEEVDFGFPDVEDVNGVTWLDVDNDGDADLFYLVRNNPPKLFENIGDLVFIDITDSTGIDQNPSQDSYGASWADYNKDGFLDLYVSNYNAQFSAQYITNYLYKNNGDNTFTNVTEEAGVGNSNSFTFVSNWFDYNGDGWVDLYVGNDRDWHVNEMYMNNGDGTFDAVGEDIGCQINIHSMTNTVSDYDNDGDLDVYITNSCGDNQLLEYDDGFFTNQAPDKGLGMQNVSWGANWLDFDNDMDIDIYVSTSSCGYMNATDNFFYVHNEDHTFTMTNEYIGNTEFIQLSNTICDYNNDGKMDIVAINNNFIIASLFKNIEVNDNNYLKVSLQGTVSNRDGISSWIHAYTDSIVQTRYTHCGEDFMAQDSPREHFGMGQFEVIDSLIVTWLSGHVDKFYDVPTNQTLHIIEGSSIVPEILGSDMCVGSSQELLVVSEFDSILWNTGDITSSIFVDEPGVYSVRVFSDLGVPSSEAFFEVNYFNGLELDVEVTDISCFESNDGSIELTETGSIEIDEVYWNGLSGDASLSNLAPGNYEYSITDINGCITEGSIDIAEPSELLVDHSSSEILCFGDCNATIDFDISGGTGTYIISDEQATYCSGMHNFIIQDENLCETSVSVEINEPDSLQLQAEASDVSCFEGCDGSIDIIISGGTPEYFIDSETENLCAGSYEIVVSDEHSCLASTIIEVLEPDELEILIETTDVETEQLGSAMLNLNGGIPPYIIEWSDGSETETIENLEIDSYWVLVTDSQGCSVYLEFEISTGIEEYNNPNIGIYPNPTDGLFNIKGIDNAEILEISIFDPTGRVIYKNNSILGSIDLSDKITGLYIVLINTCQRNYSLPLLVH